MSRESDQQSPTAQISTDLSGKLAPTNKTKGPLKRYNHNLNNLLSTNYTKHKKNHLKICWSWYETFLAGEAVLPFWRVAPLEATCAHPTGKLISTARCGYCWLRRLDTRHRPGSVMATFGFPLWLKVFAPSALLLFFELFALLATLASAAPPSPCWEPRGGNPSIIDMLSFLIQANALFKMFYYILNKIHPLCFCGCKV